MSNSRDRDQPPRLPGDRRFDDAYKEALWESVGCDEAQYHAELRARSRTAPGRSSTAHATYASGPARRAPGGPVPRALPAALPAQPNVDMFGGALDSPTGVFERATQGQGHPLPHRAKLGIPQLSRFDFPSGPICPLTLATTAVDRRHGDFLRQGLEKRIDRRRAAQAR